MMKTLLLNLILVIACSCTAQTVIPIDVLKNTKWIEKDTVYSEIITKVECLDSIYKVTVKFGPLREVENTYQYYLSPVVPTSFDFSMVGKKTFGSYLVGYNSKMNKMFYYEIVSFEPTKLVLLRKGKPYSIGGANDLYMTYERIR